MEIINKKFWLVFMAGPGSLEDLKELVEPIKQYFDGIVAVYHGRDFDDEAEYLESVKGAGQIIYLPFCRRHDFSRNHYLYCGPIKEGDWCLQIDVLERLNPEFAKDARAHADFFQQQGANIIFYYNKPFLFEFHESLQYFGNPHEGLKRLDGKGAGVELSQIFPIENNVRFNVRPIKRPDPYHFVDHYVKYYLYPWGANHCLLGIENRGQNISENFQKRDAQRLDFKRCLREAGISNTVQALKEYILKTKPDDMDPNIRRHFNTEKILNDFYRFHVVGDRQFKDNHDWKDLVKI